MLMKRLVLYVLCLILTLSGCGYYLKVIKPETPSTKAREAVDNPNSFKEEFVIADASDIRYYKEYWGAAARYLYDTTKLQLYIVELNEFDYNGIETQEAANYRVRDYINENIFSKDPYAIVLGSSDVDKLPNGIAIDFSTNYETWYYGAVASEWFDANARVIWKECYDLRYNVDYDLDSNYVWVKGAVCYCGLELLTREPMPYTPRWWWQGIPPNLHASPHRCGYL